MNTSLEHLPEAKRARLAAMVERVRAEVSSAAVFRVNGKHAGRRVRVNASEPGRRAPAPGRATIGFPVRRFQAI